METKMRILNITTAFQAAGIESFIMNMYHYIDRTKVQFDFMVMRDEKEFYDDEIAELGGKKYTINVAEKNTLIRVFKESIQLYKFLKNHQYQIVHIHYTTPLRAPYLLAAKKAGVPVRIYHSHSAEVSGKSKIKLIIYEYFRKHITDWATHMFACSEAAARWMFSEDILNKKEFKVIYNGIDIKRFRFNEKDREEIRKKLKIDGNYVLIHTGRFLEQKNHRFVIEVFKNVKKRYPQTKLLLLGEGDLVDEMKELVESYQLTSDIIFMGVQADVQKFLSAADCYIMPSFYEGLPVAAIEAQCSGLPCILSENITREVKVAKNVEFLSLNDSIDQWCEQVLSYRYVMRRDCSEDIIISGYDIQEGAKMLQEFYMSVV